jgi:hypothetical protein
MPLSMPIERRVEGEILLRILRSVEAFEDAMQRGESPRLEDLLHGFSDYARAELLRQSLGVELEYRRRRGEKPALQDYLPRFPDDHGIVEAAFAVPELASTVDMIMDTSTGVLTDHLPSTIGKFVVLGRLGGGSQGSAYLARDPDIGWLVVLKRYHTVASDSEARSVGQDGTALSRLRSRYTPQCFGLERVGDERILVMEYVPGRNLSEIIASGLPSATKAARLVEQVAEGLEAVHACGMIHRDIKPSNIVQGDGGLPRLVDFGLAAHVGSSALRTISGTPPYMAPEQARGQWERIDARTDIYGLGAVLYTLLTGVPPHPGASQRVALEHAKEGEVKPPREYDRSIPRPLESIVMRALAADPNQRYATAANMRQALRGYRIRHFFMLAGLAGLLLTAMIAYTIVRHLVHGGNDEPSLPLNQAEQLIKVDRGGRELSLLEAVPLVRGDKLWIVCDVPAGWHASAFWFDTEGELTELSPLKIVKGKTADGISYPSEQVVTVAGPPGTEFILVCARPGSPVGRQEVDRLLLAGAAWPALPPSIVVRLDHERITLNDASGELQGARTRGPGSLSASAVREAIRPIEEARARLASRVGFVAGVAFAHCEESVEPRAGPGRAPRSERRHDQGGKP